MEPRYILILINWVVYCQLLQQQETPRRSSPLPCLVTSLSLSLSLSLPKSRREPSQLFVSFWRGFPLVFGNPWLRENGNSFYVILSCTGQTRHPQKTHRKWVFGFLWCFSHDKNIIKHIIVIHYSIVLGCCIICWNHGCCCSKGWQAFLLLHRWLCQEHRRLLALYAQSEWHGLSSWLYWEVLWL